MRPSRRQNPPVVLPMNISPGRLKRKPDEDDKPEENPGI
jgi:hypothetical protein